MAAHRAPHAAAGRPELTRTSGPGEEDVRVTAFALPIGVHPDESAGGTEARDVEPADVLRPSSAAPQVQPWLDSQFTPRVRSVVPFVPPPSVFEKDMDTALPVDWLVICIVRLLGMSAVEFG